MVDALKFRSFCLPKRPAQIVQSQVRLLFRLFVCFVALRPKSTAMVMVGRSVHLTTLFLGQT